MVRFPAAALPADGAVLGEGEEAEVAAFDDGEIVAGPLAGSRAGSVGFEDVFVLDETFLGPGGAFELERFVFEALGAAEGGRAVFFIGGDRRVDAFFFDDGVA